MKSTLNQVIFSLATIAWGVVPVYLYASGLVVHYLASMFHLISLLGGLGMIVLGLFNLIYARRKVGCGHDHHDHGHGEDHDHAHDQSPVAAIFLMLLPVLVCTGFTKHEYSTRAVMWKQVKNSKSKRASLYSSKREPFTREVLERTTRKTEEGDFLLTITELFWSAGDQEIMKAYEGIPAQLEGRFIDEEPELNPEGNRKRLYRVFMTCCAADAQVLALPLEFEGSPPDFPDKTWVVVKGKVAYEKVGKQDVAYLENVTVEKGEEPPPQNRFQR